MPLNTTSLVPVIIRDVITQQFRIDNVDIENMTSKNRWEDALDAEKTYNHFNQSGRDELKRLLADCQADESLFKNEWVLEVGAGNGPVYTIEDSAHNVGVDPFSHKKDTLASVSRQVDTSVTAGLGEQLPYSDESFGVVICNNVLDHVQKPPQVIAEMQRVLESDGLLLLRVNVFPIPQPIRKVLNQVDKPHPHHFHPKDVVQLVEDEGMKIDDSQIHSQRPLSGHNFKKRIATGVFRFRRLSIAAKK